MTPEEKAKELYDRFETIFVNANADSWGKEAKQCALICVDLLIEVTGNAGELITKMINIMPERDKEYFKEVGKSKAASYWQSVKEHLNK